MNSIIAQYQKEMYLKNIAVSIISTADYHMSEYIPSHFKIREYLSGFTGSNGTLVITIDFNQSTKDNICGEARLWTDGRYFIQAALELENSGIYLMKEKEKGVPTVFEYISKKIINGGYIGINRKLFSTKFIQKLITELMSKGIKEEAIEIIDFDIIDKLWPNRPLLPLEKIYKIDEYFVGKSYKEKKKLVIDDLKKINCDSLLLTSLEDQAWLYNLRGNDIAYTPVFLAYTLLNDKKTILYTNEQKFSYNIKEYLDSNEIIVKDYFAIYEDLKNLKGHNILVDPNKVNYELFSLINKVKNNITLDTNVTAKLKAIKNDIEIENTKRAHIKDGVAVTKFIHQIKNMVKNNEVVTEFDASNLILKYRKQEQGFIEPSFESICAYNENAAMMHYTAKEDKFATLENKGILLVDSGGHYLEGSTDITRTIALGEVSNDFKKHFTYVLKAVINLSKAVFIEGTTGANLDVLARTPIWSLGLDYKCGTGHGIGHILGVHEGPNNFRYNQDLDNLKDNKILPGMITTNEPGIYLEGKYGIRTENEMLCIKYKDNEWGKFYKFETITYAPIDLDLIDPSLLTLDEKEWLNAYHKEVYTKLSPFLNHNEVVWLANVTTKI